MEKANQKKERHKLYVFNAQEIEDPREMTLNYQDQYPRESNNALTLNM